MKNLSSLWSANDTLFFISADLLTSLKYKDHIWPKEKELNTKVRIHKVKCLLTQLPLKSETAYFSEIRFWFGVKSWSQQRGYCKIKK